MPRSWHALLTMPTAPFTALLWWDAFTWLVTFTLTPASDFEHLDAAVLIPIKAWWAWPAALAVLVPIVATAFRRGWLGDLAALYRVAWWLFLSLSLFAVAPGTVAAWGRPAAFTIVAFWLLARRAIASDSAIWRQQEGTA